MSIIELYSLKCNMQVAENVVEPSKNKWDNPLFDEAGYEKRKFHKEYNYCKFLCFNIICGQIP